MPLEVACGREGCSRAVRQLADAAFAEGKLASAVCGSEHGFDEIGGEAARSVGRSWARARTGLEIELRSR